MAAASETLQLLHEETAMLLLDIIKNGVELFDKDGAPAGTRKATAAEINAAVAFLDKNDIRLEVNESEATRELAAALAARRARSKPTIADLLQ